MKHNQNWSLKPFFDQKCSIPSTQPTLIARKLTIPATVQHNLNLQHILQPDFSKWSERKKSPWQGFKGSHQTQNDVWFRELNERARARMYEHDTSSCRKSLQINDSKIYWVWYCPKRNIFIYGFKISRRRRRRRYFSTKFLLPRWLFSSSTRLSAIDDGRSEIRGSAFPFEGGMPFQEVTHGKKDKSNISWPEP